MNTLMLWVSHGGCWVLRMVGIDVTDEALTDAQALADANPQVGFHTVGCLRVQHTIGYMFRV